MKIVWCVILIMLFSGCATQVPTAISKTPAQTIRVDEVRMDIDKFSGSEVRWGGVISKVENKASQTWIEIVSRELRKNGQPLSDSKSSGRFIASFSGFMDPVIYKVGASVTVVGSILGERIGMIGEYTYRFPVVLVNGSYLWPQKAETVYHEYYPSPWIEHDPWPYYFRPDPFSRW